MLPYKVRHQGLFVASLRCHANLALLLREPCLCPQADPSSCLSNLSYSRLAVTWVFMLIVVNVTCFTDKPSGVLIRADNVMMKKSEPLVGQKNIHISSFSLFL